MSGFYGADTGQLRDHSELMRSRARSISALSERLQPALMDESSWQGPDADAFRTAWASQTAGLFEELTSLVARRAGELDHHAQEQDDASAPGEHTPSGEGSDGDGSDGDGDGSDGDGSDDGTAGGEERSWWDHVTDGIGVYNDAQGLWNHGKKVWDLSTAIHDSTRFITGAEDIFQLAAGTWRYGQEITNTVFTVGQEFSGVADEIANRLNLPTGIGNSRFFGWVDDAAHWAGETAPFLGKVAPFIGKALPGLDVVFGGAEMIEGISSGDTFSAITGGASALGGGLMIAGGALSATGVGAVVGGPIAAAGAILSGGAALADVGRTVYENWDSISATASEAWNTTTDFVGESTGNVAEVVTNVVDSVSDGISNAVDGLADALPW